MDEIKITITRKPTEGWVGDYKIEWDELSKSIVTSCLVEATVTWYDEFDNDYQALCLVRIVGFDLDLRGFHTLLLKCVVDKVINYNLHESEMEESVKATTDSYLKNDIAHLIVLEHIKRVLTEEEDYMSKEEREKFMSNYYKKG